MLNEFEKVSLFFYENGEMNYIENKTEPKNPVFFAKIAFTQATQDVFVRVFFSHFIVKILKFIISSTLNQCLIWLL